MELFLKSGTKLGVSCRVKGPVGAGLAPHPSRVLRPWRRRTAACGAQDGRSVDRASWRPEGGPRPLQGGDRFAMAVADGEGVDAPDGTRGAAGGAQRCRGAGV